MVEERFWAKVDRSGGPEACWPWTAGKRKGYGHFSLVKGISVGAHKFSYELAFGPLPEGLYALHRCDNPTCVNPKHLFPGTLKDNSQDMVRKGRGRYDPCRGSKNGMAKLSEEQVAEIRKLSALGLSQSKLAKRFGVSQTSVSSIVRNKRWKHHG